jgi:hypothetical protein
MSRVSYNGKYMFSQGSTFNRTSLDVGRLECHHHVRTDGFNQDMDVSSVTDMVMF